MHCKNSTEYVSPVCTVDTNSYRLEINPTVVNCRNWTNPTVPLLSMAAIPSFTAIHSLKTDHHALMSFFAYPSMTFSKRIINIERPVEALKVAPEIRSTTSHVYARVAHTLAVFSGYRAQLLSFLSLYIVKNFAVKVFNT